MRDVSESNRYRLTRSIARGGMAEVFDATILGGGGFSRRVAIKRLRPELAVDPVFVEAFVSEARLVSQLHHANIVTVFDFGTMDGLPFQALEFVDGVDLLGLEAAAKKQGLTPPPELWLAAIAEVAHALDYAHRATDEAGHPLAIVHRDVTPGNVLVSWSGDVKLGDFGVASSSARKHRTQVGVVMGKLAYLAPEQINGTGVDARTDVFALGCVLHRMLAKKSPLEDEAVRTRILTGERAPVDATLAPELARIVARAIEPDRQNRYPTAAHLAGDCSRRLAKTSEDDGRTVLRNWLGKLRPKEEKQRHPLESLMVVDLVLDEGSAPMRRYTSVSRAAEQVAVAEDGPTRIIARSSAPPPKRPARQPSDDTPVSVELAGFADRATQRAPEATVVNRQASLSSSDSSPLMSVQAELVQPEESSADLGPGDVIGEYRLIELIGRGGFAHVYRAKHLVFGEDFAVKVLRNSYAGNAAAKRRFQREAMAMTGTTHKNLVRIADSGVIADGRPYLAMELIRGETLRETIIREGPLPLLRARNIASQLAEGLAEVHRRGFVHRDLKPKNIMIVGTPEGDLVKILDFGLTRLLDPDTELTHLTTAGRQLGTARWMAPEQITDPSKVGPAADLYAIGLVLYAMITGTPPFGGPGEDVLQQQLEVRPRAPAAAGALAPLLLQLLEKDPAKRPASAEEVASALAATDFGPEPSTVPTQVRTELFGAEPPAPVRKIDLGADDDAVAPDPTNTAPLRPGAIAPLARTVPSKAPSSGWIAVMGVVATAALMIIALMLWRGADRASADREVALVPTAPPPSPLPVKTIVAMPVEPAVRTESPEATPASAKPAPSSSPSPRLSFAELSGALEAKINRALAAKGIVLSDLELVPSTRRSLNAWRAATSGRDAAALSPAFEQLSAAIAGFTIDAAALKKLLEETKRQLSDRTEAGGEVGDLERRYLDLRVAAGSAEGSGALALARKIRALEQDIRNKP